MAEVDDLRTRGRDLLAALIPTQRGQVDEEAVRTDDELIEALRTGRTPDNPDDPLVRLLASWRTQSQQ